jgi:nucleoside-diphosphate-sugar epimerase
MPSTHPSKTLDYICHVASPFFINSTDPIKELVEPAVEATRNVMRSAIEHGREKLKRVIILSSFASVVDLSKNPRAGYVYTEKDWDPVTLEQAGENGGWGYHASKTFAERTAWEMWKEAKEKGEIKWDLITFCPPMIYGPPLHQVDAGKGIEGLNTSLEALLQGITGAKVAIPGLPHWVDVRDVALAHLKALQLPAAGAGNAGTSERLLLCSSVKYYEDGLAGLREKGTKGLGEKGEKCDAANHFVIDTSKTKTILGLEFRSFEAMVEDVWAWAEGAGMVGK